MRSGALAAKQRRDRGAVSTEEVKRAEALERRQRAMDRWGGGLGVDPHEFEFRNISGRLA